MVNNSYTNEQPYEKLIFYKNILIIRKLTSYICNDVAKIDMRLASQMRMAARSAKQNIIEGYKKDSALYFANFIKISLGSLEELKGDYEDLREDNYITNEKYNKIHSLIEKTCYMIVRYLDSLYTMHNNGSWKKRWNK